MSSPLFSNKEIIVSDSVVSFNIDSKRRSFSLRELINYEMSIMQYVNMVCKHAINTPEYDDYHNEHKSLTKQLNESNQDIKKTRASFMLFGKEKKVKELISKSNRIEAKIDKLEKENCRPVPNGSETFCIKINYHDSSNKEKKGEKQIPASKVIGMNNKDNANKLVSALNTLGLRKNNGKMTQPHFAVSSNFFK